MIMWLAVMTGGFVGAIVRGFIGNKLNKHFFGTFIVNILGSIVLAFMIKAYLNSLISDELFALLGIGFSGSFTTFSTFNLEVIHLFEKKKFMIASFYLLASIILSLLIVYIILTI